MCLKLNLISEFGTTFLIVNSFEAYIIVELVIYYID